LGEHWSCKFFLALRFEVELEAQILAWLHESIEIIAGLSENVSKLGVAEEINGLEGVRQVLLL
jgi:hypothetical protein